MAGAAKKLAAALRLQHASFSTNTTTTTTTTTTTRKKAVVVGATSGIGQACARRLAESNEWTVIAIGRDRPDRAAKVIADLESCSTNKDDTDASNSTATYHEFRSCDAFSLKSVKDCADDILNDHKSIDALIMTQGMATIQGFTPTVDGNDEKLSLHYWSRMAFASLLLPALCASNSEAMPGGPVVLTVLSGGVHGAYKKFRDDPELKKSYSVKNAADIAGFYSDLGFDALSRRSGNDGINIIHASPGFVSTNWGTEMPWFIKGPVRAMQKFGGMDAKDCAEIMLDPVFRAVAGESLIARPNGEKEGIFVMSEKAKASKLTPDHSADARSFVWDITADVLRRAGIDIEK